MLGVENFLTHRLSIGRKHDVSLANLKERGVVIMLEQRGADCRAIFARLQELDPVTKKNW